MKKATLIATALICASLLITGTVSAQPVAGFSPNLAYPQPTTSATLREDANRLIRWQGWLDVDAFSVSVLNQMQKQLGRGIEIGKFTIAEEAIADAVLKAASNPTFIMNENLNEDRGESLTGDIKLYVWTYRHNFADTGLYQLYISIKGKMLIGRAVQTVPDVVRLQPHRDIQSLRYEFGPDLNASVPDTSRVSGVVADVEIWRGAVVRVNPKGEITFVGNEAGVVVGPEKDEAVEKAPIASWEVAPSLEGNVNYRPRDATGAAYVAPLDRKIPVTDNSVQTKQPRPNDNPTGTVRTISPFRLRPH